MDWFIDRRGKSVASSAKRVVEDLHKDLDTQRTRVKELERACVQLQEVATKSLKEELFRLEMKRKELLLELEETDDAILDRREKLRSTENSMKRVMESEAIGNSLPVPANRGGGHRANINESFDSVEGKSSQEIRGVALEEEFLEETEMLRNIKELLKEQVLFVIHSNNVDDVIVYFPSSSNVEIISSAKLEEHDEVGVVLTPTGNLDTMMNYGPQIVPNHERDFPHVQELVAPLCMRTEASGEASSITVNRRGSTGRVPASDDNNNKGQLLGAVRLPLMPDVIIDIWRLPDGRCWATTSVDGTSFGVIERIFVSSETTYSVSVVVAVDIYGRHAAKNYLLAEKITS